MEKLFSVKMRSSKRGAHLCGAEAIVGATSISQTIYSFVKRALSSKRGLPDSINLKVEPVKSEPIYSPLLPVFHVSQPPKEILPKLFELASVPPHLGLSFYSLLLKGPSPTGEVMRGALIVKVPSGERVEPDKFRGVRASFLGITKKAILELKEKAGNFYTERLKDALVLTSKICSYPKVLGELCVSDDPDYTTGYFSVPNFGYFRLFDIKPYGLSKGGRVVFVNASLDVPAFVNYLESKPFIGNSFPGYYFELPL